MIQVLINLKELNSKCSSDHNGNELEINNREIKEKSPSSWKLNSRLLNNLLGKKGSLRGN